MTDFVPQKMKMYLNIDIDKNRYKSIRRKYVRKVNALKYLIKTF